MPQTPHVAWERALVATLALTACFARAEPAGAQCSRWNYQLSLRLSARAIVRYQRLNANPSLSSLAGHRDVNVDLLFTYLVQPGTALYVGLNADRQARLSLDRGRQIFVKMSYLLQI